MGYGEYDGGGSVRWKVKHSNGVGGGSGRDPVDTTGQSFSIYVNGELIKTVPITANDDILIIWTPDTLDSVLADKAASGQRSAKAGGTTA